jgi:hypothetical protein
MRVVTSRVHPAAEPERPQLPLVPHVVDDQQHRRAVLIQKPAQLRPGRARVGDRRPRPAQRERQIVDLLRQVRAVHLLPHRRPQQPTREAAAGLRPVAHPRRQRGLAEPAGAGQPGRQPDLTRARAGQRGRQPPAQLGTFHHPIQRRSHPRPGRMPLLWGPAGAGQGGQPFGDAGSQVVGVGHRDGDLLLLQPPAELAHPVPVDVGQRHRDRGRGFVEQKHQPRQARLARHVELELGERQPVAPARHRRAVPETHHPQVDVAASHLRPAHLRRPLIPRAEVRHVHRHPAGPAHRRAHRLDVGPPLRERRQLRGMADEHPQRPGRTPSHDTASYPATPISTGELPRSRAHQPRPTAGIRPRRSPPGGSKPPQAWQHPSR